MGIPSETREEARERMAEQSRKEREGATETIQGQAHQGHVENQMRLGDQTRDRLAPLDELEGERRRLASGDYDNETGELGVVRASKAEATDGAPQPQSADGGQDQSRQASNQPSGRQQTVARSQSRNEEDTRRSARKRG
jgi:hypothetical protein